LKNLILLNVIAPALVAAGLIAAARFDEVGFLLFLFSVVMLLGLSIVNLFAPILLWEREGPRSLVPVAVFVAAVSACGVVSGVGSRLVLAGTPSAPDTFLRGSTRTHLEALANELLDGGQSDRVEAGLRKYGFIRTSIDTVRRVVTLKYYRMRIWTEYLYAANGLPAAYSTEPRLTQDDFVNWGELRSIAEQAAPETKRAAGSIVFEPSIAVPYIRQTLGDSLMRELRLRPPPRRITREEKALVIAALNWQCLAASRLIEDEQITYEGNPPMLHIGATTISRGFWVSALLERELKTGVLARAPDGRHLTLTVRSGLSERARHAVEWLHVGLMNFIYGDLLEAHDYIYDRQLEGNWYFRSS
jgi:hypothetical protein